MLHRSGVRLCSLVFKPSPCLHAVFILVLQAIINWRLGWSGKGASETVNTQLVTRPSSYSGGSQLAPPPTTSEDLSPTVELHTQQLEAVLHLRKENSQLRRLREQDLRSQRSQSCEPLAHCEANSRSHQPDCRSQSYDTLLMVATQDNPELMDYADDPVLPQDDQLPVNEEGLPPLESGSVSDHDETVSNSTIQFV